MAANFGRRTAGTEQVDFTDPTHSRDIHLHDDTDSGHRAHHHTLGPGPNQAFPGLSGSDLSDEVDANIAQIALNVAELANHETRVTELETDADIIQTFTDDMHDISRWTFSSNAGIVGGQWTVASPADSEFGSKVFDAKDVNIAAYHFARIPFDPNALYRIRVRVRGTGGAPKFYAGVRPFLAGNVTNPGTLPSGNCYVAAAAVFPAVGAVFTEYVGYLKGFSAGGSAAAPPGNPLIPSTLPAGTMTFAPIMLPVQSGVVGDRVQISMYKIEVIRGPIEPFGRVDSSGGSVTIVTNATGAITFNHALGVIPTMVNIAVHSPATVAADLVWRVTARTATQVTVEFRVANTGAVIVTNGVTFMWEVKA